MESGPDCRETGSGRRIHLRCKMSNRDDRRDSGYEDIYSYSDDSLRKNASGGREPAPGGEIDRYNYVDRDVYSSSGKRSRSAGADRKRGGRVKRFFRVLFTLLILLVLCGAADSALLYSRLDRAGSATGAQMAKYAAQPAAAPAWDVKSAWNVTNVLLIGVDRNGDGSDGRSDSNMLISVNHSTRELHMVSFLRDTYLDIPTVGKNKFNAAYASGGPALTMQTLENNYRIGIDQYIEVDFSSFSKIIDEMGGLDVPMSKAACDAENLNMGSHLKAGTNHLDGKLCLYYTRIRDAADEHGHDDYGRAGRQRQVIQLIISKMKHMDPISVSKILYDYFPYVKTNLSYPDFMSLAFTGATISGYKTEPMQIPAEKMFTEASVPGIGSVLKPDLEKNCALLRATLYGSTANH